MNVDHDQRCMTCKKITGLYLLCLVLLILPGTNIFAGNAPVSRLVIRPEGATQPQIKPINSSTKVASRTFIGPEADETSKVTETTAPLPANEEIKPQTVPTVILPDTVIQTPVVEPVAPGDNPAVELVAPQTSTIAPETPPVSDEQPDTSTIEVEPTVIYDIQMISPEDGATITLTPSDAANMTVANNTDLIIALTGTEQSQAQYLRALGIDDITASLSGRAGLQHSGGTSGSDSSWSAGLNLTKVLLAAGGIERSQEAAAASVKSSQLNESSVKRLLDLAGYEAAFNVLQTRQLVGVAVEEANALKAHLVQTEDQLVAGTVAKFEVLQAQTELARAQGNVISAQTNYIQALSALKRLLMLPQETVISVIDEPGIDFPVASQSELIAQAISQRPEVQQAEVAVRIAELNQKIAKGTNDPTVSINGSVNESKGSSGVSWELAVSVQKPILDGRELKSETLNANAKFKAAQAQLIAIQADVAQDVVDQYTAVQNARERLRVAQQGVVEATERRDIAIVRFNTQYGLGIEVVDAESALTSAQAERINAMYDLQTAQIKLLSITGGSGVFQ